MVVTSMAFLPRRAGDGGSLPKSISFVINFAAGKELAPLKIRTGTHLATLYAITISPSPRTDL